MIRSAVSSGATSVPPSEMLRDTCRRPPASRARVTSIRKRSAAAVDRGAVGVSKQDDELLAAPADHVIAVADVVRERPRNDLERVVTDVVPVAVVDQLEAVEVGEQNAEIAPEGAVLREPAGEHGLTEPAIAHAGQRVTHRGVEKIGRAPAAAVQGAIVMEGLDRAGHLAGRVAQRRGRHAHRLAMPVLVVQVDVRFALAGRRGWSPERAPISAAGSFPTRHSG